MRQKPTTVTEQASHATRIAWWASFLATLALVAILGLARSAQAETVPAGLLPSAVLAPPAEETEEEEEGEEEERETCKEAEEEGEECEEETAQEVPDVCMLKSTEAAASVLPAHDTVQVTLHYTTFAPAVVSIQYSLRGGKGGLKMGADSQRFSRKGVFRDTEKLTDTDMAKVKAATEFDVRMHAVNTPGSCRGLFDRELTARHSAHGGSSWTDPKASQRPEAG